MLDQRLTFWLDSRDAEALALLARRNGRSTGGELRQAVRAHLASSLNVTSTGGSRADVGALSNADGARRAPV